jgi:hypothetical protein
MPKTGIQLSIYYHLLPLLFLLRHPELQQKGRCPNCPSDSGPTIQLLTSRNIKIFLDPTTFLA